MDRFWSKVDMNPHHCWEWLASTHKGKWPYGQFWYEGKMRKAHRVAYLLTHQDCPDDLVVRHTCDNPICVNPDHLILGTVADNNKDTMDRGRFVHPNSLKTHCKRGHEFTIENTYIDARNGRQCRQCLRMHWRKAGKKKKKL
jgi:hypothetical protein